MKVLLIQPRGGFMLRGITHPVCRDLMMSATFLKQRGYDVCVWDRCIEKKESISKTGFHADAAIFFISQSSSVKDAARVSSRLRADGSVILWADMIAVLGQDMPDVFHYCDYLFTGEFCFAADELLQTIQNGADPASVAGIAFEKGDTVVKTAPRALPDFSALFPIDWSLIDVAKCFRRFPGCKKMLYLNASVGCPFFCGFCSTPVCYGARRKRPMAHVIQEIDYLVQHNGLDGINFSDELLLFTDEELQQLKSCRERNGNSFIWGGETRPQFLTRVQLMKMHDAGCRWLMFGLESGSSTMRTSLNKSYDPDYIRDVVNWCSELGIATFGSFIIGFPDETERDLYDTVQFALSLDLDAFLFNFFVMIPNSPLYHDALEKGSFRFESVLEFDDTVNTDKLDANLSRIPYRDLATVKAYFDFLTITRKKKNAAGGTSSGRQFMEKAVNTAMEYLRGTPKEIVFRIGSVIKRGFCVFYYPLRYPIVIKKYGLRNINRGC